jgi:hypothetical protein
MKAREERQKVMLRARMRDGIYWHDVCVLNMSGHGLGIQAARPPDRGTYVEICRGGQSIIARVAWSRGHRAGLRAQDALSVAAFANDSPDPVAERPVFGGKTVERRRFQRSAVERYELSRFQSRSIEFACLVFIGGTVAVTTFGVVHEATLATPLGKVTWTLH